MADDGKQHTTITVPEIAKRLGVCQETVYEMLKEKDIPNLRHRHRFIVSRAAYEHWEATIGQKPVLDIHDQLPAGSRGNIIPDRPLRLGACSRHR